MNMDFENALRNDLHDYLHGAGHVDEKLPECPDVEEKWQQIAEAYLPDGVREFNGYPKVSLGWMMYIGMAVAKYWDMEWEIYSNISDLYVYIRDKRGYDYLDEYVCESVLRLGGEEHAATEKLVGECASRIYSLLCHQHLEPGTPEAFRAYVSCLHQLYLMGAAVQLNRMGYHMTLHSL